MFRILVPTLLLAFPALLGAMPSMGSAQTIGVVTDRSSLVDVTEEWAGVILARAAAAIHSGDLRALEESLSAIASLAGGVDQPLAARDFPVPSGVSEAERDSYVIDVLLPYLEPGTAGQPLSCAPISGLALSVASASGDQISMREFANGCTAGPLTFTYQGEATRVGDGAPVDVGEIRIGELPIVVDVLDNGRLRIEAGSEWGTLLAMAAGMGRAGAVALLMDAGADPDVRTAGGSTALIQAASSGQVEIVGGLLEGGAEVNLATPEGKTALMGAAAAGHVEVAEQLLRRGVIASAPDVEGRTALHYAVGPSAVGSPRVVESLARSSADLEGRTNQGSRPLHLALEHGHEDAARALLSLGADASVRDGAGRTPLSLSIESGLDLLDELVAAGADIDALDDEGRPALHVAVISGDRSMVEKVLELGGSVDARDDGGSSALMVAAETGQSALIAALLQSGAALEATDNRGNRALHRAAAAGRDGAVEALLRAGAARGPRNADGRSPNDVAGDEGHGAVQSLFRHTKLFHLALIKVGGGFTRLGHPQHESSTSWEFGLGLGIRAHERVRLQAEVAWATRTTDPLDEGAIALPPGGDLYYAAYSVDVRPSARIALGNPYRTHGYLLAGVNFSTIEEVELLDWTDSDADGVIVTDQSDTEVTSLIGGLGVQKAFGRTIVSLELVVSRASEVRLDPFEGSWTTYGLGFGLAW